jgi:hypothetical protein
LKSASHRLLPRSLLPFVAPKPLSVPLCWAPSISSASSRSAPRCLRVPASDLSTRASAIFTSAFLPPPASSSVSSYARDSTICSPVHFTSRSDDPTNESTLFIGDPRVPNSL